MTKITCPFCGSVAETETEIFIGQHVICPYCEKKFAYGDNATMGAENPAESKRRFCRECGTKIPSGAAFCPGCGQDVLTEKAFDAKVADFSKSVKHTVEEQWSDSGKLQKLFSLIWLSAIVSAISVIASILDVREYYSLGKCGTFIFTSGLFAMEIWLYVAMMRRKSWARKTFVILNLLRAATLLSGFEMSFATILGIGNVVIRVYCVYLCFGAEVVEAFLPDAKVRGSRAAVNRYQCKTYVLTFVAWMTFRAIWGFIRYGSEAWDNDCMEAIVAGSSSAKDEMIDYISAAWDEQGIDNPSERAKEYVEAYVRENSSQDNGSNDIDFSKLARGVNKSGMMKGGVVMMKFIGTIVVGIFTLVGGFISKRKQG